MAIQQFNLPAVMEAADRGRAFDQQQSQQNRLQQIYDSAFANGIPTAGPQRQQLVGDLARVDPQQGMQWAQYFSGLDEASRKRAQSEAPVVARALAGATPENYGAIRGNLARFGVDTSDWPEQYDQNAIGTMRTAAQFLTGYEPGQTRTVRRGVAQVTEAFDPMTGRWSAIGTGAAFAPPAQTNINVGPQGVDYGKPEAGLVWARNPDGSIRLDERGAPVAVPYQGGSVFREQQALATQQGEAKERKEQGANVVIQDIDRSLQLLEESPRTVAGIGGAFLQNVPSTSAHDVRNLLESVRAASAFERLQQMREASPTGGALGQVTERELALLQNAVGSLEQSQSPDQFGDNLRRVRNLFLDIVHGPGQGPERSALGFEQRDRQGAPDFGVMSMDDLLSLDATSLSAEEAQAASEALQRMLGGQ